MMDRRNFIRSFIGGGLALVLGPVAAIEGCYQSPSAYSMDMAFRMAWDAKKDSFIDALFGANHFIERVKETYIDNTKKN